MGWQLPTSSLLEFISGDKPLTRRDAAARFDSFRVVRTLDSRLLFFLVGRIDPTNRSLLNK